MTRDARSFRHFLISSLGLRGSVLDDLGAALGRSLGGCELAGSAKEPDKAARSKSKPIKTTNKKSAEPDSDRKGVDDEYPHYKLKEDEKEPKFQSVHRTSSFDATFGRWYANYVPLSTKKIQSILGKEKVSVFHVGNAEYRRDIQQVARIVGKKGTLSTFTSVDKGEKLAKGRGIQSGGGIIYQIEGTLLVASTRDMQSMPDNTGRRWIAIQDLAGKVAGGKTVSYTHLTLPTTPYV